MSANWKTNQKSPTQSASTIAGPSGLTFSNITLDGTLMGWVGSGLSNAVFSNITSIHYGDLQDAEGNNVGGVGKWFAPPHLFYLNDYALAGNNAHLEFTNITDAPAAISATNNGAQLPASLRTYTIANPHEVIQVGPNGKS